jgi:alanyl-tRNA synthetase
MQALSDYRMKQDNVTAISQALSVKRRDTRAAVERLLSDQQGQKERIAALSMALVEQLANSYEPSSGNICVFDNLLDEVALRELVNRLMEKCGGIAAAFSGSDREGYRYIMGSLHIDLRAKSKELNTLINGRGGGKPQMIQGSAMLTENEIREQLEKLQN